MESLRSLKKEIGNALSILGLMPSSYSQVHLNPRSNWGTDTIFYVFHISYFQPHISFSIEQALEQLREKALKRAGLTEDLVLQKIEERTLARKNKEYEKSDGIRKELAAVGIAVMDGPDGTSWRPSVPLELQECVSS